MVAKATLGRILVAQAGKAGGWIALAEDPGEQEHRHDQQANQLEPGVTHEGTNQPHGRSLVWEVEDWTGEDGSASS